MSGDLREFVKESNRIEGIKRAPTLAEVRAHAEFLALERVTMDALKAFVMTVAKRTIRDLPGMDVRVGGHMPPRGGPHVHNALVDLLASVNKSKIGPYSAHHAYETLHPFMDGNGRSGRVLWLWQMVNQVQDPYVLSRGFLHSFYYQALQHGAGGR